jgi:hypothetical protein
MCLTDGVIQAYVDDELSAADAADVAAHVGHCMHCQTRAAMVMERAGRVGDLLAATAGEAPVPASKALARFYARVERGSGPSMFAAALRSTLSAGAVAATVLAVAAALRPGAATKSPVVTSRATAVSSSSSAGLARAAAVRVASRPAEAGPPTAATDDQPLRRAVAGYLWRAEGDYLSLTEDNTMPEVGMVLRTVMPLPTQRWSQPDGSDAGPEAGIEVDVLVGQDGRALAIRLVDQTTTPGRK